MANSVTDTKLRDKLLGCSKLRPCWATCCPTCARRRAHRFFKQSFSSAVQCSYPPNLRWVTVNVCSSPDLASGSAKLADEEHRALAAMVRRLQRPLVAGDMPLRVWGAREVEPHISPTGLITWRWHWHLIVDLGGVPEADFAQVLRARWSGSRDVRIDPIRNSHTENALKALVSYPVKGQFTGYDVANKRHEWLSAASTDDLAQWMVARGARWFRFRMGTSDRKCRARLPQGASPFSDYATQVRDQQRQASREREAADRDATQAAERESCARDDLRRSEAGEYIVMEPSPDTVDAE